jgi:hypothetical protein
VDARQTGIVLKTILAGSTRRDGAGEEDWIHAIVLWLNSFGEKGCAGLGGWIDNVRLSL